MIEFVNHVYKDLIQQYSSWNDLKSYLTSPAGGSLHISDVSSPFCIIRSKHNPSLSVVPPHSTWFRSTVWNMETNRPVSVVPPKTSKEFRFTTCQELVEAGALCQAFLDGFMITCFVTKGSNEVHITSRSKLDATGQFYSSKTFRQLFLETYRGREFAWNEDSFIFTGELDAEESGRSYSFLVQHVEHRVVTPIVENRAFLVQWASIKEDGAVVVTDGLEDIPQITLGSGATTVSEWVTSVLSEKDWTFQGIVLKDVQGNRWRFRNSAYLAVKTLRGNSAAHVDRFAHLYLTNKTQEYLKYYPEESFTFVCNNVFMNMIHQIVYNYYVQVHITKTTAMNDIESVYRRHVYQLHKHYVNVLRPQKKKIRFNEVVAYCCSLSWQSLVYLIRGIQDSYFSQMNDVVNQ
jgi:hypothetical protein